MIVEPYDYFVLCASMDMTENGGVPCDAWFKRSTQGDGMALANNPDEVVLTRPDGIEIDRLEYAGFWLEQGASIGLDPALDDESNDDFVKQCRQVSTDIMSERLGTPGGPNVPATVVLIHGPLCGTNVDEPVCRDPVRRLQPAVDFISASPRVSGRAGDAPGVLQPVGRVDDRGALLTIHHKGGTAMPPPQTSVRRAP